MGKGRIAFVPPRYGDDVVGGAETVLRQAADGWPCGGGRSRSSPPAPGTTTPGPTPTPPGPAATAISPSTGSRSSARRARPSGRASTGASGSVGPSRPPSSTPGSTAASGCPACSTISSANAHSYRAIVLSPYLFWTTVRRRHGRARTDDRHSLPPRRELRLPAGVPAPAGRFGPGVVHVGARAPAGPPDRPGPRRPPRHRRRHPRPRRATTPRDSGPVTGSTRPYVLFAGRREAGKGWQDAPAGLRPGGGPPRCRSRPRHLRRRPGRPARPRSPTGSRTSGSFPDEEVGDAYAAAAAYVQPSLFESFSRTIMESWLAGTPVIANGACEVVRWHCERSGAGLLYADEYELAQYLALGHRRARASVPARTPRPGLRAGQLHVGRSPRSHGGGVGGPSVTA